ncbi:phasin family protein [Cohaesibacter celericrescens]|uniref:Phasin family protein n=1 Tax=Cohaesibacter celericrescens TaxID=2067669 RepID=A0A2N5XKF7_9HYPH|nr:phasin family protein [Cohaesibacter celericrescens]PLW74917.1 phasin family protein [Cohaesibacter celericrescens]
MTATAPKAPAAKAAAKATPAKKPQVAAKASAETASKPSTKPGAKPDAAAALAFAMPNFELPETLMPDGAIELAEKSLASARDTFAKTSASVEEQSAAIEKSIDCATKSAKDLNQKTMDAVKSNMDAGFNFLTDLMAVKSFSDAIELQTAFAGKQFETFSAQSKDLQESLTKGIEETSAPVKAAAEKTMESIKAA